MLAAPLTSLLGSVLLPTHMVGLCPLVSLFHPGWENGLSLFLVFCIFSTSI